MATLSPVSALKAMEAYDDDDVKEEGATSNSSLESGSSRSEMPELSLYCDAEKENKTLENILNIALLEIDHKTGREIGSTNKNGKKWQVHKSRDKNIELIYRKMENEKNITLRSKMDINCNINELHKFFRCDLNDDLTLALEIDKMMKSFNVLKVFDEDRAVIHSSFTTGIPKSLVKPRDFCWMKRRIRYTNYGGSNNGKNIIQNEKKDGEKKIDDKDNNNNNNNGLSLSGVICYSLDESHPNYVPKLKKHVRGWINYSGMIFVSKSENISTLYYVVSVDPCGKIPKTIINICAPQQGMNIKHFATNIDKAKQILMKRNNSTKV